MGLVIGGEVVPTPGLRTISYLEDPYYRAKSGVDFRPRPHAQPKGVVLHVTQNVPPTVKRGRGPADTTMRDQYGNSWRGNAGDWFRAWGNTPRQSSAHLVVDWDGTIYNGADLRDETAFHASKVNDNAIGIEIHTGFSSNRAKNRYYDKQLDTVVKLVDWLTRQFGIQRQVHYPFDPNRVDRLIKGKGADAYGVYSHRDVQFDREDPGDEILHRLVVGGYEQMDLNMETDKQAWRMRQAALAQRGHEVEQDGVPGPKTVAALQREGKPWGQWVWRPGDSPRVSGLAVTGIALLAGLGLAYATAAWIEPTWRGSKYHDLDTDPTLWARYNRLDPWKK